MAKIIHQRYYLIFPLLLLTVAVFYTCANRDVETTYYENGKVKSIAEKRNGNLNGNRELYFPSGKIKSRAEYIDGFADGWIEHFYENGKLESVAEYSHGVIEGYARVYSDNGQLLFRAFHKKGKIVGTSLNFHKNGKLRERKLYDSSGIIIHDQVWDTLGIKKWDHVRIEVKPLKDSVKVNEDFVIQITFSMPMSGDITIQAWELDPNDIVSKYEEKRICKSSDTVKYQTALSIAGKNTVTFNFFHSNQKPNDTLNVDKVSIHQFIMVYPK